MNKLLCINNINLDPYFNLAFEEYLLKNYDENIFMLWQNNPVVVVGKHQNTLAEINLQFIDDNNIKVARRLSGGGTVYHDKGNLNFTYIMNGEQGKLVDFVKYTEDILHVLNQLGVPAERNQRNDLLIHGEKISGNAEHIFKNRVIHHGTLLFNSDLSVLNESIKIEQNKFEDKSVKSVRSKVTNILPYLTNAISIEELKKQLFDYLLVKYQGAELFEINADEYEQINILRDEKYSKWDWIFGYSPKFKVNKLHKLLNNELFIEIYIKKGMIDKLQFIGTLFSEKEMCQLKDILTGKRYQKEELKLAFVENPLLQSKTDFTVEQIVKLLF